MRNKIIFSLIVAVGIYLFSYGTIVKNIELGCLGVSIISFIFAIMFQSTGKF